jgi:hypothetical protein
MGASSIRKLTVPVGPARQRMRALPKMTPIALVCGGLVVVFHLLTPMLGQRIGVVTSGIITAILFLGVGLYSVRKRNLWFSLRMMYLVRRIFPNAIFEKMVFIDRLETWRAVHVTVAMLSLLPFWWHMERHMMGPLEAALASAVALLFVSGLFGVLIQDRMPPHMTRFAEHEVRSQDVNAKINAVYVEAEEKILGHKEIFIQAYLASIKPRLVNDHSSWQLLLATIARRDMGAEMRPPLESEAGKLGDEAPFWGDLVDLTVRKINLEQNDFNLWLSNSWLSFHIVTAVLTGTLLVFHVLSVLYYGGA